MSQSMIKFFLIVLLLYVASFKVLADHDNVPLSIDALRIHTFFSTLNFEHVIKGGPSFHASLYSYDSFGLKVYTMVAIPKNHKKNQKLPAIIANHGFHPDPPKYGITAENVDFRPGDYYRAVPEMYTREGFIVVMPDYRGHNVSEGSEFTHGYLAPNYYAQDVLSLLSGIESLKEIDSQNIFMWGHSMGGLVTLQTLLVSNRIKGASLWSSVGGNIWDRTYYYSRYKTRLDEADSIHLPKVPVDELVSEIKKFSNSYDWKTTEPNQYLQYLHTPLIIHHAILDTSALHQWSAQLAGELYLKKKNYHFYSYKGSEHLFTGNERNLAVQRDITFFRGLMDK